MAHNEISTTLSHSHGRGDNLNTERDREALYNKPWKWEGFDTPPRINTNEPVHYHGPSWQDILDERERAQKKKRNAPKPVSAFHIETFERTDGAHCNELARKLDISESAVWAAHKKGIVTSNWVIVDRCTEVPYEHIKKSIAKRDYDKEQWRLRNQQKIGINSVRHYAVNIFTGERFDQPSAQLLAEVIKSTSGAISRAATKRFIVQGSFIVWSDRHPIKEEDIEWRLKRFLISKKTGSH